MALTISGGTTVGTQLPAATIKAIGCRRVQLDATGTYVTGGHADLTTALRAILGTRITPLAVVMAKPGGAYYAYWDAVNDTLMLYVGATGVEVANAASVTLTNLELDVFYQ